MRLKHCLYAPLWKTEWMIAAPDDAPTLKGSKQIHSIYPALEEI